MIHIDQLIENFTSLGLEFLDASQSKEGIAQGQSPGSLLGYEIERAYHQNPWFFPAFSRYAFKAWSEALQTEKITEWILNYLPRIQAEKVPSAVGIIMAGNIPLVGLHDLFCVLASGNHALIKLASKDEIFIPGILKVLCKINPAFEDQFQFVEGPLKNFDAIVATGSNNSSRYFDYYFGKYPHIIRKNRNSVAVLTGQETDVDLTRLGDDIFLYFGLGCRNVSKIYLPERFRIEEIFPYFEQYSYMANLHKYRNNYDYQKSILLINRIPHYDTGFLLTKEDTSLMSPISVIHIESYHSIGSLDQHLKKISEQIQCVVSCSKDVESAIPPGRSQFPELWDYADGVDTMKFLIEL
jgi:hypothetical protein